jgi:hypothetical protein
LQEFVRHTLGEFFGSVHPFSGAAFCGTGSLLSEKENNMSKDKNLQFCMDKLQSMQNRDGLEPEQMSALDKAESELKRLWRKPNPHRREIFKVVRKVAEAIIKTFAG